jgi:hypothetical protein
MDFFGRVIGSILKSQIDSSVFMKLNTLIREIMVYLTSKKSVASFDAFDIILIKFSLEGIIWFIEKSKISS